MTAFPWDVIGVVVAAGAALVALVMGHMRIVSTLDKTIATLNHLDITIEKRCAAVTEALGDEGRRREESHRQLLDLMITMVRGKSS